MEEQVKEVLEELRVSLQADGGDLEFVKMEHNTVFLRLTGACAGCPFSQMTLKDGIERVLKSKVSEDIIVERAE
ncbi:MAG: NifU family protein [Lentisphaeria bacterium]